MMRGISGSPRYGRASALMRILVAISCVVGPALADESQTAEAEDNGVRIQWRYTPSGGGKVGGLGRLEVALADARSGAPLQYQPDQLAGWLHRSRAALSDAETPCADRVAAMVGQGIGQRADIDLAAYRLLTLNDDGVVAFINPFVGLNNAKLESIVSLGAKPIAWAHAADRMELWILVESSKLVGVDLQTRRILREIALTEDGRARSLALESSGRRLWISLPGRKELAHLDLTKSDAALIFEPLPSSATLLPASHGRATADAQAGIDQALDGVFIMRDDGAFVWREDETRSKIWSLDARPTASAYSALARRIIVASADGALAFLDPEADATGVEKRLRLEHNVRDLSIFDGGRMVLALGDGRASVIDLATGHVTLPLRFSTGADQLLFTRTFAYAIDAHTGRATLWSLSDLKNGRAQPVETSLGHPDSVEPDAPAELDDLAAASPDGAGIIFASRADGTLYQYAEGMMAPSGSFSNYKRKPVALMLLDLSLRAISLGKYAATVRHNRGGAYDLLLAGRGPRFSACARLQLPPVKSDAAAAPAYTATFVSEAASSAAGDRRIRVRLQQAVGDKAHDAVSGLRDLTLLVFDRYSGWQMRAPMREVEAGDYEAQASLPHPGRYDLHVSSVSRNISFLEGRLGQVSLGSAP